MLTTTALLVSVLLSAPPAAGGGAGAAKAAEDDETRRARELFQLAQKLYKGAKYAEAIVKFEEAAAVRPHPVITYNIGKCHEQLGDTPRALRAYRDYLRLAPDAKDRQTVLDAVANLERRLKERGVQQLMVFADPATARIEVDGKGLGTSPATVELSPGNHRLTVSAEGFEAVDRSFVMPGSRSHEMTVNLQPAGAAKEPVAAAQAQPAATTEPAPAASPTPAAAQATTTPPAQADAPRRDQPASSAALTPAAAPSKADVTKAGPAPAERKKGRLFTWVAAGVAAGSAGAAVGLGLAAQRAGADYVKSAGQRFDVRNGYYQHAVGLETGTNVAWGLAGAAAVTAVVLFFVEGGK